MAEIENEVEEQPKKSSSKLLIVLLAMGLLGGGGAAWWFLSGSAAAESAETSEAEETVKAFVHLESFVVNLAEMEGQHFLRLGIDLGLKEEPGGEEAPMPTALIRDTIIETLTTWRSEDLLGAEGKKKLKEELTLALQARLPELGIKEVYFNDFLVQR